MTIIDLAPESIQEPDEASKALVKSNIGLVLKGKSTLADMLQAVRGPSKALAKIDKAPPPAKSLSEATLAAIQRLPEVFGKVNVVVDRALTKTEAKSIVEERETIDLVLKALKERKEESIREIIANHLDAQIPQDERESTRLDARGHFAPWETQNFPVEGTDKKFQRSTSGGKPNITIGQIEKMLEDGVIDRKTYLAITKVPDNPRFLDEHKLHEAIQKDPMLFFKIAQYAEPTKPITTIKVV